MAGAVARRRRTGRAGTAGQLALSSDRSGQTAGATADLTRGAYFQCMDTRRARIVVATLLGTFIVIRVLLHRSPESDFDVAGYNIHHLFTGLLLITAGGLPIGGNGADDQR